MPATADLIQAVEAADTPAKLLDAARALARADDPAAIPMLIRMLQFNNPGAAVAAVEGLVRLGEVAVQPLLENIDGYNYGARAWATRALAQIADPRALDLLLAAGDSDFAPSVRRAAVKGVGSIRWDRLPPAAVAEARSRALPVLLEAIADLEWVVRYAAAAGLQALAEAIQRDSRAADCLEPIRVALDRAAREDDTLAVRLRSRLALETCGFVPAA